MKAIIKKMTNVIVCGALLMPMVSACAQKGIKASKNYVTKEVKVPNFDAIELLGSPDVVYTQSKDGKTSVQIYGSDNLIDLLDVSVQNNTLIIKLKPKSSYYGESRLEVRASSPSLNKAMLKGSGDIKLDSDINADKLEIALQGSGDIKSNGNLYCEGTLKTTLQGSGDIDFYKDARCSVATVSLQGSGDVKMKNISAASGSVSLQGSGDVSVSDYCKIGDLKIGLQGSGDIKIKNIESTMVHAGLSGSGDIDLTGNTQKANLSLQHSGDVKAARLKARSVEATVKGSGEITCYATDELSGNIQGSGEIRYKGTPKVQANNSRTKAL